MSDDNKKTPENVAPKTPAVGDAPKLQSHIWREANEAEVKAFHQDLSILSDIAKNSSGNVVFANHIATAANQSANEIGKIFGQHLEKQNALRKQFEEKFRKITDDRHKEEIALERQRQEDEMYGRRSGGALAFLNIFRRKRDYEKEINATAAELERKTTLGEMKANDALKSYRAHKGVVFTACEQGIFLQRAIEELKQKTIEFNQAMNDSEHYQKMMKVADKIAVQEGITQEAAVLKIRDYANTPPDQRTQDRYYDVAAENYMKAWDECSEKHGEMFVASEKVKQHADMMNSSLGSLAKTGVNFDEAIPNIEKDLKEMLGSVPATILPAPSDDGKIKENLTKELEEMMEKTKEMIDKIVASFKGALAKMGM